MLRLMRLMWVLGEFLAADLALAVRPAAAGVFTLLSDPGYYNNGSPVSAKATITTADNGTVTIDLTNTEDPTLNMGQVLTGFTFTLSDGATTGTVLSSNADVVIVKSDGSITDFHSQSIFGSNIKFDGATYQGWTLGPGPYLSVFGTGGPNFGGLNYEPDSEGYADANGSIRANSPHNPFSRGTMEFVMSIALKKGESAPSVTGGTFQFGTNQNGGYVISVPDKISTTPEPSSLACWCLLGLSSVGLGRRKARKNRSSVE